MTTSDKELEDTAGRRPHVPPMGSKSNTVAEAVDSVDRPVVSFERQLHVFVCALLGLDDEDHEDDEAAEPLENAIKKLIAQRDTDLKKKLIEALPEEKPADPLEDNDDQEFGEELGYNQALSESKQAIKEVYGE